MLEVLVAARQFVVHALRSRSELDGGPGVGGEELRRLLLGDAVPDVLDGVDGHAPTQTRTARRKLSLRRAVRYWLTSLAGSTCLRAHFPKYALKTETVDLFPFLSAILALKEMPLPLPGFLKVTLPFLTVSLVHFLP